MSTVAAFLALATGGAYAANTIGSVDVIDESLLSADIKDGEVRARDIGASQVLGSRIVDGTVKAADLADNGVTSTDLADNGTLSKDIADGTVQSSDLKDDGVTGADVDESTLQGLAPKPAGFVFEREPNGPGAILAEVGPWRVTAACWDQGGRADLGVSVHALGGAGDVQWSGGESVNDGTVTARHGGLAVKDNYLVPLVRVPAPADGYRRVDRTAYLRSGTALVSLTLNAYADDRAGSRGCKLYGHAARVD
jgi:hypothetical protein